MSGFFDGRKGSEKDGNDFRFGLVFEKSEENVSPISLHYLIREDSMPSLSDRIRLAHKTATCIVYLHAVNWLRKALRSDNILLFPKENETDLENPSIAGLPICSTGQRWGHQHRCSTMPRVGTLCASEIPRGPH